MHGELIFCKCEANTQWTIVLVYVHSINIDQSALKKQKMQATSVLFANMKKPTYMVCTAHNSLCVCTKNWQISVCGEWYTNHSQMAHCMFAVLSTCMRIWYASSLARKCVPAFICPASKVSSIIGWSFCFHVWWGVYKGFYYPCVGSSNFNLPYIKVLKF